MELDDNKAGMGGLDKDQINNVIRSATGAKYQAYQQKREEKMQERLDKQQRLLDTFSPAQIATAETLMDQLAARLEEGRDLSRTIVHVDMDAFYAAVEMRDDPRLRSVPMAVGSNQMLSTSNYLARRFGVRAAMPGFIARKLCAQLVIRPCDFAKYRAVSEHVRSVLAQYDPGFAPMGLDEAYLDLTNHLASRKSKPNECLERVRYTGPCQCRLPWVAEQDIKSAKKTTESSCSKCGKIRTVLIDSVEFGNNAEDVTNEIRFKIEQKTGLTASAGISPNTMLAKVCSDFNKPNGQYLLEPRLDCVVDFVRKLPIRKVCGIGKVSESLLSGLGIVTCGDLFEKRAIVSLLNSEISTKFLLQVSLGLGSSFITRDGDRKSVSVERTFDATSDRTRLFEICDQLCQSLAGDINQNELKGKTVTLKLKTSAFENRSRAQTLMSCVWSYEQIYPVAREILQKELDSSKEEDVLELRLMGVRLSSLVHDSETASEWGDITKFILKNESREDNYTIETQDVILEEPVESFRDKSASSAEEVEIFKCPICSLVIPQARTEEDRTEHVENCLSRQAIGQLLRNDSESTSTSQRSSSSNRKRKRPQTDCDIMISDSRSGKTKCLENYFASKS